ncbi:MAG: putative CRISPR-associated protein, partial [Pseudothermotoga sp.]
MDYKDTVICTVGASLLTNLNRDKAPDYLKQLVNAFKEKDHAKVNHLIAAIQDPLDKSLGAEINSVANIVKKGLLSSRQQMYLLVSDTPEGEQIGEILKGYFEKNKNGLDFNSVKIIKIEKLNDKSTFDFKFYGLRNLVREMARCIKESGNRCIINATGGYKATVAYSTLLGQALKVPVYYLFERFDEIIELLQVPVKLDTALYKEHSKFFAMLEYKNVV